MPRALFTFHYFRVFVTSELGRNESYFVSKICLMGINIVAAVIREFFNV